MSDPSLYHRPLALDSIRTEAVAIHDFTSGMINNFMTQLALSETVVFAKCFDSRQSGTPLVTYENVSFSKTQEIKIMQPFLVAARFAIEGFFMMLQDTEDEVGLQMTL